MQNQLLTFFGELFFPFNIVVIKHEPNLHYVILIYNNILNAGTIT